jgi:glycogen operon protein
VSQVKLIAEPWDIGEGGYQLGNFPPGWSEWNDRYRDTVRAYWRGDGGIIGEVASRLAGSSDIFQPAGRQPTASINFVTSHDGFTLHDLVSHERKHNEANLEGNRDGADDNRSWNCGTEGPTGDAAIRSLRERYKRNLLATLFLSQGVPMLLAGDELGRTQRGNNNAYCQDNDISWVDWQLDADKERLLAFTQELIQLRKRHPALRRRTYPKPSDVAWLTPQGGEMTEGDWKLPFARCLGMLLLGDRVAERDASGAPIEDDDLLVLVNAHHEPIDFRLPDDGWQALLDTAGEAAAAAKSYPLKERCVVLLAKARSRDRARTDG